MRTDTTSWIRVLLEKLTVIQLVRILSALMEPDGLLPYSQELATGPSPEPDASSPRLPTLFS
jgi:hypothetical protein